MQITIDTQNTSRSEAKSLMRLLLGEDANAATPTVATGFDAQKCREAYENTYHKVAADIPFDVWEFVWKKAHSVSATSPGKYVAARIPADMPTPEITALLADLNAELYSRRIIKPDDNPTAGVELPAASVAGMDDMVRHGAEAMARDFIKKEVIAPMVEAVGTLNLAGIFASASGGSTSNGFNPVIIGVDPGAASGDIGTTPHQLDKNGLPWDSRIHAASKAINADGTWRQKRGVAPELVATVEAQLRGVMAVPVPPGDTHGSPELDEDAAKLEAMGGDAGPTLGDLSLQSVGALEANLRVNRMPPPPPVATPPTDPTTFPELVAYITAQKLAGKLTQAQLDAALQIIGVQGALPVMAARPDLIPALVAKLRVAAGG